VVIVIGSASVIALTLLTSSIVGVIWAATLLGFGAALAWRSSRGIPLRQTELSRGGNDKHRLLVVASQTVGDRGLLAEIQNRCGGQRGEILVVTPALTGSRAAYWGSDVDAAIEEARKRMELSLRALKEAGLNARGQVGDPDPNVALEDALRVFAADEVVISTHPPDRAPWLERGVVQRAREEIDLPVTHVVVDLEDEA
jgi:GABA permease